MVDKGVKTGSLVHVPADVSLYMIQDLRQMEMAHYHRTQEPTIGIVMEAEPSGVENFILIHVLNKNWFVKRNHIFNLSTGEQDV